jgi:glycosyltransferase involved in cell wall biosynthesis
LSRPASNRLAVVVTNAAPRDPALLGSHVREIEELAGARELVLYGWALAEEPVRAVEVVCGDRVVAWAPVTVARADIAELHPELEHAGRCGFEARVRMLAPAGGLELDVRAVTGAMRRVPIAAVAIGAAPPSSASGECVTVVVPCFNQAHFLPDAIDSVLAQTHSEIAVVVVDDGSRDNTAEVAARYPGVRWVTQENRGLAAARNAGLQHVETDFVVFLDSDDRLLPEAIETGLRELAADPDAMMAAGAWRLIGEDGRRLPSGAPELPEDVLPALLESCFISTPAAVIYRRRLFDEIGGFDPEVSASADYDLYLRVAARRPVRIHREVVAEYRRHGANMTRDAELILRSEIAVLRRQSDVVRRRPDLRRARERGLRRSRAYHGERMVDEIRRQVDEGRRDEAVRAAATLARLHPRGVPEAVRALRRPRLP